MPLGLDAAVEALFQAYFLNAQNIGDREILVTIAASTGLEETAAHLAGNEDISEVFEEVRQGCNLGIQEVPHFILDGKYAVSGAQEPEVFYPLFDIAREVNPQPEAIS